MNRWSVCQYYGKEPLSRLMGHRLLEALATATNSFADIVIILLFSSFKLHLRCNWCAYS